MLDGDGEYHRLGEAKSRRANLRLVGATNRSPDALKHNLLARLPLRLLVPGLGAARRHSAPRAPPPPPREGAEPRSAESLRRPRRGAEPLERSRGSPDSPIVYNPCWGLDGALSGARWRRAAGRASSCPRTWRRRASRALRKPELEVGTEGRERARRAHKKPGEEPPAEEIRAAITANGGNLVQSAKALGLPTRYSLYRLLRKHGINTAISASRATDRILCDAPPRARSAAREPPPSVSSTRRSRARSGRIHPPSRSSPCRPFPLGVPARDRQRDRDCLSVVDGHSGQLDSRLELAVIVGVPREGPVGHRGRGPARQREGGRLAGSDLGDGGRLGVDVVESPPDRWGRTAR